MPPTLVAPDRGSGHGCASTLAVRTAPIASFPLLLSLNPVIIPPAVVNRSPSPTSPSLTLPPLTFQLQNPCTLNNSNHPSITSSHLLFYIQFDPSLGDPLSHSVFHCGVLLGLLLIFFQSTLFTSHTNTYYIFTSEDGRCFPKRQVYLVILVSFFDIQLF